MFVIYFLESKSSAGTEDTALAVLQTRAAESEEESENLVKQLLEKELNVEQFLEKFMQSRKIMHTRKFKSEKMVELIRQSKSRINASPYNSSGFYPAAVQGGNIPYPTGPMFMPMPGAYKQY